MTERLQVYKCNVCGNIVEVLNPGVGTLVCCNQPMELLKEKTEDLGLEKHVPIIEKTKEGVIVKVGSMQHPMEEKHFIQWIELITDNNSMIKFLKPGEKPEAEFKLETKDKKIIAREHCNIHGFWKSK
ncbi:MAG: desulfoferrodoxin [Candidatus Woesearchaeota archaeon]